MNKRLQYTFIALLLVGALLRIIVGTQSLGFVHPDEHQQYLEAANRIAYGYGVMFWEYERGIRHYLYPSFLASLLHTLDFVGITTPILQAQVIRSLMGLTILGSLGCYAHRWLREGKTLAAFALLVLSCFSPYFLFVGARTLSETAVIPLLVMMLYFVDRKPVLSGLLGGLMFAVRFHAALFVAPFFAALCVQQYLAKSERGMLTRYAGCLEYVAGVIVGLIAAGAIDYLTWGAWFHSPLEYFQANILEGVAASFGVTPWYQYIEWLSKTITDVSIFIVPFAIVGMRYKPCYAFAAIIFFVAHSLIGHKESRFIWSLAPVALIFVAEGLQRISHQLTGKQRYLLAVVGIAVLTLAVPSQRRPGGDQMGDTKANSLALASVGRMDDVEGVAVRGGSAHHGNLFYLRKNVPYVIEEEWKGIESADAWLDGEINYLISSEAPNTSSAEFTFLEQYDQWKIFRVRHKPSEQIDAPLKPLTNQLVFHTEN